jgi:hypothetical protein
MVSRRFASTGLAIAESESNSARSKAPHTLISRTEQAKHGFKYVTLAGERPEGGLDEGKAQPLR